MFRLMRNRKRAHEDGSSSKDPAPVVEIEQSEYNTGVDGSNALVLEKRKKKDTGEEKPKREKVPEKRKYAEQKKLEKTSKTKKKKLQAILNRKERKIAQEDLIAASNIYRLDDKKLDVLASTAHRQDKHKEERAPLEEPDESFVAVPKKIKLRDTIHNRALEKGVHFETDSESEGEEEEEEEDEPEEAVEEEEKEEEPLQEEEVEEEKPSKEEKAKDLPVPSSKEKGAPSKSEPLEILASSWKRQTVLVTREDDVQSARSKLPVFGDEQSIVETINEHVAVIVCGETGSGKTTQIPQMLYEAGYCTDGMKIAVTEPRRVAAISMAARVGHELGDKHLVSYQIRYEGTVTDQSKIVFMTDGVLLQEMSKDVGLKKGMPNNGRLKNELFRYSVVIVDEAHERSMYSDVLIGLLSRVVRVRAKAAIPLKLVIMSATLRLDDFLQQRLFPVSLPPVVKVDARQFPVTIHFERRTPDDFICAAYRKACTIHEKLPEGGLLIFVPGQQEVHGLIKRLHARYPMRKKPVEKIEAGRKGRRKGKKAELQTLEMLAEKAKTVKKEEGEGEGGSDENKMSLGDHKRAAADNEMEAFSCDIDAVDVDNEDEDDSEGEEEGEGYSMPPAPPNSQPLYCLPLYSLLPPAQQRRVFDQPPAGTRLCVVATNVAETSLTIPGIRFVVDTGFEKRRRYDPVTGVACLVVSRISQASADQRAGRAGRVGPGHSYRLYSSAVFEDLEKFSRPQILDMPLDQLVLKLKSMHITKVVNFPFPSRLPQDSLEAAEKRLIRMGALQVVAAAGDKPAILRGASAHLSRLTQLGRTINAFPVAPGYAKVLALAQQHQLLPQAIMLIAALSVREPMLNVSSMRGETPEETKAIMVEALKRRKAWTGRGQRRLLGDLLVLVTAIHEAEKACLAPSDCARLGVRPKAMLEIRKLRVQLTNIVNTSFDTQADVVHDPLLPPPDERQATALRQLLVCCLPDRIARKAKEEEEGGAGTVPRGAYRTQLLEEFVYLDACSVIYKEEPEWVLYQEIVEISGRKCLTGVAGVEKEWLSQLAEPYCSFGEPPKDAEPVYSASKDAVVQDVPGFFGARKWPLGSVAHPLPVNTLLYRHFARLFLAGEVFPSLAKHAQMLLAPPSTMLKSWADLLERRNDLLSALIAVDGITRAALEKQWERNPDYLKAEYMAWLPVKMHPVIEAEWPPIEDE